MKLFKVIEYDRDGGGGRRKRLFGTHFRSHLKQNNVHKVPPPAAYRNIAVHLQVVSGGGWATTQRAAAGGHHQTYATTERRHYPANGNDCHFLCAPGARRHLPSPSLHRRATAAPLGQFRRPIGFMSSRRGKEPTGGTASEAAPITGGRPKMDDRRPFIYILRDRLQQRSASVY